MKTNHLKRVVILLVLVISGTQLFAQELYEIKVKLVKYENQVPKHTNATLLDAKTMEIIAKSVCNDNNELIFENVSKGEYLLQVRKPGLTKADTRYIIIDDKVTVFNSSTNPIAKSPTEAKETQLN